MLQPAVSVSMTCYVTACTDERPEVIEANNGTISTIDFPAPYPNNAECGWRFQAEEGQVRDICCSDLPVPMFPILFTL